MTIMETMIEKAKKAMENSYSPYSKFSVGACLRTDSGKFFYGCNVENASYGLSICAEANAIADMVKHGERCIVEIVVMGPGDELCTPCGACRQMLNEFTDPQALIHICGPEGLRRSMTMAELLPESFGPDQLSGASD